MSKESKRSSSTWAPMLRLQVSWTRFRRARMRRRLVRLRHKEEALLILLQRNHLRLDQELAKAEQELSPLPVPLPQPEQAPPEKQEIEQALQQQALTQPEPARLTPGTPMDPEPLLPQEETPPSAVDQISQMLASPGSPASTSER